MRPIERQRFKVAALQMEPRLGDKAGNVHQLATMIEEAAGHGARVIVAPEMATSGYCWFDREEIAPLVETIPGPTTERLEQVCRKGRCHVAVGMPEIDPITGAFYNSLALVGPGGYVGKYRKIHSYVAELTWAKDGDLGFPVWETEYGVLGAMICQDVVFFEPARALAIKGADLILFPTNWLSEKAPSMYWISRAFENGVYFVAADRCGEERGVQFSGGSAVLGPDGHILASLDAGPGIVYADVDLDRARDKRWRPNRSEHRFHDRSPRKYQVLALNRYLWNPIELFSLYGRRPLPEGAEVTLVAIQYRSTGVAPEVTLDRLRPMLEGVMRGALVVLPEEALCGRVNGKDEAETRAELLSDSVAVKALRSLASEKALYLIATIPERGGDRLYHTAVLVGSEGLIGHHRKVHLTTEERAWATPGECGFETFDLPFGRLGILMGYESLFPESAMCLAVAGADIVAVPSALEGPAPMALGATAVPLGDSHRTGADPVHWHHWRTLAHQSNVWVVFANQWGTDRFGWSGVFGPVPFKYPRREALAGPVDDDIVDIVADTRSHITSGYATNPVRVKDSVSLRLPHWYEPLLVVTTPVHEAGAGHQVADGRSDHVDTAGGPVGV